MIATDFTRHDCLVGRKRRTYDTLRRDWRCADCGGRIGVKWSEDGYYAACGRCNSRNFVHEAELDRQEAEAAEVLAGLPAELAEAILKGE